MAPNFKGRAAFFVGDPAGFRPQAVRRKTLISASA